MASPEKKARYDVSRQVKDAIERDDWTEVARILSECSRRDSDSVMTQLVSRDQWDAVKQVIRCVGDEERTWSIEGVLVKNNILLSVAEGNWRGIGEMPHERFLHSTLDWVLQQACKRAQQTEIVRYVLPHCEDDQLDSALEQLVTHGLWFAVGRMLPRNVDVDRDRWVIQQACQRAEELVLRAFVIPFCHKSNLDLLMTELVSRDMWRAVCAVLMRGVSFTQHCWVLKEACCRAESCQLERIVLPYCALDHCNSATKTLVSEEQWSSVCKLLNGIKDQSLTITLNGINVDRYILHLVASRKGLDILKLLRICENDSKRVWSFCQKGMTENHIFFQLYCRQHDSRLKRVRFNTTNITWTNEKKGFPEYITDLQNVFAVIFKASPKTNEEENRVCIVPSCAGTNLDFIFTQCFDKFLENSSNILLHGFGDSQRTWVVGLLRGNSSNTQISEVSVLSSTDEQLYNVLRQILSLPAWWALGKVLEQGLDDNSVTHILKQILLYDDDEMIVEHVLPHCTDSQTDLAVTELVSAGQWKSVTKLVHLVGDRKETWTVAGTSVDTTLLHLVAGGRWGEVGDMLQRGVDDAQFRWAVDTVILNADDECAKHVLSICEYHYNGHINLIMTKHIADGRWKHVQKLLALDLKKVWTVDEVSVERGMLQLLADGKWQEIGVMLTRGVSDPRHKWLTHTASLHTQWMVFRTYILPHCADDQLECMLTTLVERRQWGVVGEVLKRGVSDTVKQWAVMEACQHGRQHDDYYIKSIVTHCADDQLDSVLTTLMERRLWEAAGETLKRGVSDSVKRWAVMEACQHCDDDVGYLCVDDYIEQDIIPHCADDQLDSVLTTLVERRLWCAVGEVLKRGVSDSLKRWAVTEACQHCVESVGYECADGYMLDYILPHCADDQLDSVLTTLVERRLWCAVGEVLKRGVSDSLKRWAVTEACQHCVESVGYECADGYMLDYILPHCADDQLYSVLTTLVERRLWRAVEETLKGGVGDSVKGWAVQKVCQHFVESNDYEYIYITHTILPYCADDQLESVLSTLVERRLWEAVAEVLKRGVSDTVKQWAVQEACEHGTTDVDYIIRDIVSHCSDDRLDIVLTTLVERRMWESTDVLLGRGVSDSVKRWAVMEACRHFEELQYSDGMDYIRNCILPHCADDQVESVLITLVERSRYWDVEKVLKRCVSDFVKRFAIKEACRYCFGSDCSASEKEYILDEIFPLCADNQLDSVLTKLVKRGRWRAVGKVLRRFVNNFSQQCVEKKVCEHCKDVRVYFKAGQRNSCTSVRYESHREVSDSQRRKNIKNAFLHADQNRLIEYVLPYYVYDSIQSALEKLASRCFWKAFSLLLHHFITDTLCMWTLSTNDNELKEKVFLDMVRNPCDGVKRQIPSFWRLVKWSDLQCSLNERLNWDTLLGEVLCEVLLGAVKEIWLSRRWMEVPSEPIEIMNEASSIVTELHTLIKPVLMECNTSCVPHLLPKIKKARHRWDENRSTFSPLLAIYFTKCLVQEYYKRKAWREMTNAILIVLTIDPVVPDVQNVALRVMLRHNRWDVIIHACLSGVCEQDRRQLFQAAVKQRQWSAVKRWADHTLYDDQRLWALGEARQEKRWDVYLKLADHGLSEWERVGVLFRVTMHADWKLVRHMLKTVADVTDMIDLLTNTPGTLSKLGAKKYEQRISDCTEFKNNLTKDTHKLKTMTKRAKWCAVLHNIRHRHNTQHARRAPGTNIQKTLRSPKTIAKQRNWRVILHNTRHKQFLQQARRALKAAVSSEAWQAVMQLVRLETDVTRRDWLFRDMVRLRQWAVCRELMEKGVSHDLSLDVIYEFIEHCQWTLVAMTMKCTMNDERRKKIMHLAIMAREGSVVWECINKLQTCLSVDEREDMFQLAFSREVWQAVKPLIEEKDVTGVTHRDTALLEAIEQHQWDVVDHCQRHHADINMKDDVGHTPIHRAARKGDWEAVKELTVRDGDPNLLDREGLSVLHRAIRAEQWDTVKLLIQFHGDIHQAARYNYSGRDTRTPLTMLIDARQMDLIELTLMWCPDQWKSVSGKGETALHAAFLSGWLDLVYYLIARKVDPLAVTKRGLTALCYAVLCKDCPQRMVAECIKLGFSTHQSHITHTARNSMSLLFASLTEEERSLLMSPLVLAVMRGLPVVTQMLCEAGACSSRQLRELNVHLVQLIQPNTEKRRRFRRALSEAWVDVHNLGYIVPNYLFDTELMEQSADYLHQVSSTPRSLVSTCRLVISRCLTLSKTRHRDIAQLPLSPMMKNYLMFSDLADPRYPDLWN